MKISIPCALSLALLANICSAGGEPLKAVLDSAQRQRLSGHFPEAESLILNVLQKDPQSYRANYLLGLTYSDAKKPVLAVNALKKASDLREVTASKDYTIYNALGLAYMEIGDFANAKTNLSKGVAAKDFLSSDSYARVANNLALVYLSEGNVEKAAPLLKQSASAGNKMAQFNLSLLTSVNNASVAPSVTK